MPVDLTIVESTTELGQTVVEVVLESASAPGPTGPGVAAGGTVGQVLKKASGTDFDTLWDDPAAPGAHATSHQDGGTDEISIAGLAGTSVALQAHLDDAVDAHDASAISFTPDGSIAATTVQAAIVEVRDEAGGGGAPTDVDYLVGTASGGLSAEIVVGTTPGGELGGTWASPTVDATHSGSTHAAVQAAAEATAAAALSAHLTDATDAHDASAISILDAADDFTATDVEGALAELQSDAEADATALSDHIADTSAAHAASAISASSATLSGTGTDVQAVLEELDNLLDDHSARHENGGADEISVAGLSGELADAQPVTVRKNTGVDIGTRSRLNFIEGTNVTLTVADDAGGDEVDITIAASGGSSGPGDVLATYIFAR